MLPLAITLLALAGLGAITSTVQPLPAAPFDWQKLPTLPDEHGFAGMCAGVSDGALILAGGANFPGRPVWDGGLKTWHDRVFVLEKPDGLWRTGPSLPRPLAYGVSITTPRGLLCIGGADGTHHYRGVFRLERVNGTIVRTAMAPLPVPLAYGSGARIGSLVYVAGGTDRPDATSASRSFLALDLAAADPTWRVLDPWPGAGRMLSVAGAVDGDFYLASGVALRAGPGGAPVREYLKDVYRFTPGRGWARRADVPQPVAGAPTPAATVSSLLVVIGGDDGSMAGRPPTPQHPGFSNRVLTYDPRADTWTAASGSVARVTAPLVAWQGGYAIASGEVRPGVRSPEVWLARSVR